MPILMCTLSYLDPEAGLIDQSTFRRWLVVVVCVEQRPAQLQQRISSAVQHGDLR